MGNYQCRAANCSNSPLSEQSYCKDHSCRYLIPKIREYHGIYYDNRCYDYVANKNLGCRSSHQCTINKCLNVRTKFNKYCSNHTCNYDSCYDVKLERDLYCNPCSISRPSCEFSKCSEKGPKGQKQWICSKHQCKICQKLVTNSDEAIYCPDHECRYTGCYDIALSTNGFCQNHD